MTESARAEAHFSDRTLYLGPRRIKREFARYFSSVECVERLFLPYSRRPRALGKIPFGPDRYGLLWNRFLYGRRVSAVKDRSAASGSRAAA